MRANVTLQLLPAVMVLGALTACERPASTPSADEAAATLAWVAAADIAELRAALDSGELTVEALVQQHLGRIEATNHAGPRLHAVLDVATDALESARGLDAELAAGNLRGPLHGIPILLKGNIDVRGIRNTAGCLAMDANVPAEDAFLVARLREAGAVILGTANLSEWANFRSSRSSSGWSGAGGQTRNPHVLDRNPCGSSSGSAVAVAAGLCTVAIGTETDGSVVCPAGQNGVVGIKPTLGLVSRGGIIPIAHSQDTAGPMGRTVRDAALVLQAVAAVDPADPTGAGVPEELPDYTAALTRDARLDGMRLGVWRDHFGAGEDPDVEACLTAALETLRELGAEIVDPADLGDRNGLGSAEGAVLYTEFKYDLTAYLAAHGSPGGMATLQDIMAFHDAHADTAMPYFGYERFTEALESADLDSEEYTKALADSKRISRQAIDGALEKDGLNAIVAVTNSPAWPTDLVNGDHYLLSSSQLPAVSGYPNVTVPMCYVHELPVGLSILGTAFSEVELLRVAHAFEQAANVWRAPRYLQTLDLQ